MINIESNYWEGLKSVFMDHIRGGDVKPYDYSHYSRTISLLIVFAESNAFTEYSPNIGQAFYGVEKSKGYQGHSTLDRRRATISRLDNYLYGKTNFQRTSRPHGKRVLIKRPLSLQCPTQFSPPLSEFLQMLKKSNLKDNTVEIYQTFCMKLFCDFEQQGVRKWDDINHKTLLNAFSRSNDKISFAKFSRRLFRYLLGVGIIPYDYSGILPVVTKPKTIPSVYSPAEIKQLLDSIETVSPNGKRDYAILLLAVMLGLRASDIRLLHFKNVDYTDNVIRFVQFKTSVEQLLPMPTEVATALRDYIDNGRETTDETFIFLDGYGKPLTPGCIPAIASRRFLKSKIDIGDRHHGSHALRMSFASQLIAENMPYEIVRVALGHTNRDTTRHYVEFAIESLRRCALESPASSGLLKEYLESGVYGSNE